MKEIKKMYILKKYLFLIQTYFLHEVYIFEPEKPVIIIHSNYILIVDVEAIQRVLIFRQVIPSVDVLFIKACKLTLTRHIPQPQGAIK